MPSYCKDIYIIKFKFVAKTQFLYTKIDIYTILYRNSSFKQINLVVTKYPCLLGHLVLSMSEGLFLLDTKD